MASAATTIFNVCLQRHKLNLPNSSDFYLLALVSTFAAVLEFVRAMPLELKDSLKTLQDLGISTNLWASRVLGCQLLGVQDPRAAGVEINPADQQAYDRFISTLQQELEGSALLVAAWLMQLPANEGALHTQTLAGLESFARKAPTTDQDARVIGLLVSFAERIQQHVERCQMNSAMKSSKFATS